MRAMVNPRQIEAFRAVMLTGGVTSGAELMNVSQPAVSRLIADLQFALQLKLFERRGARLAPTAEAQALYMEVERSFVGMDRIEQAARDLRGRRSGILRVAVMPALANGVMPRFMARFLRDRPGVDVQLSGASSTEVLEWVASGQYELGFVQTAFEHTAVRAELLPAVASVAVLPEGHRLADRAVLRPEDFAGESFISLGSSTLLRYRVDVAFADHRVQRRMRIETQLTMIACALVAEGAGVSIVDPMGAEEYRGRGVVIRPFEPRITFEVAWLRSAHRPLSALGAEMLDEFRDVMAGYAARG